MTPRALDRTSFLQGAAAAGIAVAAAGCGLGRGGTPRTSVRLGTLGGDAWTFRKSVRVEADGCDAVAVDVAGRRIPAVSDVAGLHADVPLGAGENELVPVCRRGGDERRGAPVRYRVRLQPRPTAAIDARPAGGALLLDAAPSRPAGTDGAAIVERRWEALAGPAPLALPAGDAGRVRLALPGRDGDYVVALTVRDAHGRTDRATALFRVEAGEAHVPGLLEGAPAWIDQAVVYGVIPRSFGDGGLRSVRERVPYLASLGVSALWLSPILRSPEGDFGYAVTDYFQLRPAPDGGSEQDLRELVREAHRHGIRVLMDFVPNHTSDQHPYFVDAQAHGRRSAYYDYYDRDAQGRPTHYFDWTNLPNLGYDNAEVRRMVTEAFSYWVREHDVDGYRVDACWGVRDRRPSFWPELRRELKRVKADHFLLAEASRHEDYWFENGFDAAYDWTPELGQWAWQDVFDAPRIAGALHEAITAGGYAPSHRVFRFLNNNDTGGRFVTRYGADVTRVAAALLLTLPGVPCVYTGDEVGAQFLPYEDAYPISWDDRDGLRPHYRQLIELRRRLPALQARSWHPLEPAHPGDVYAYARTAPGEHPVLVLLNFGGRAGQARVPLPGPLRELAQRPLHDLLGGETVPPASGSTLDVALPALTARILTPA